MCSKLQLGHNLEEKTRTKDVILDQKVFFEDLLLSDFLLKALREQGFKSPSPIQYKAIPVGLCGFDLVVKSKAGTGKTLIFTLVALEQIDWERDNLQTLIVAPTREIALQIRDVVENIGKFEKRLKVGCFIGGTPLEDDQKACQIAVGTPGRLNHLFSKDFFELSNFKLFVLDEVDKLMEASFLNDLNSIYNCLPKKKQMIATSATYSGQVKCLLEKYMISTAFVNSELETPLLLGQKQFVYLVKSANSTAQQILLKNKTLLEILSKIFFTQVLVFCNYQTRAESVCNFLIQNSFESSFISAAQNQSVRTKTVKSLKDFSCRILCSTDLTARGIDAANVDLVINYDVPTDSMTYLHRIGRAGRFGGLSSCITLACEGKELNFLQNMSWKGLVKLPENLEELAQRNLLDLDLEKLEKLDQQEPKDEETVILESSKEIPSELEDLSAEDLLKMICNGGETEDKDKNEILTKNQALYSVSKLLLDTEDTNEQDFNNIKNFLYASKQQEPAKEPEDLFELAYNYTTKPQAPNWRNFVPEELEEQSNELPEEQSEDDVEEEPEDDPMKWVPVEASNTQQHEEFSRKFEELGEELWQNGLNFETTEAFDQWYYYNWLSRLETIRNYVQQNIYVDEMSKFKNEKL